MSLLEEIQNAAVDAKSDLGTLLRKCKLLAARLGSRQFEDWLLWESNGYPPYVKVPSYRVFEMQIKGHFAGAFGSGLKNAPVPFICLPPKAQEIYEHYECRQSVASIETTLEMHEKNAEGAIRITTGDLAVVLGTKVYQGMNCLQAWAEINTTCLIELLNAVRNRILDFSLAIWKEEPTAGELDQANPAKLEASRITQIFNTTIFGGSANLVGSANDSTITFNVTTNDFASLGRVLRENGVSTADVRELRIALKSDEQPISGQKFGPQVSSWIAKMMGKAADGTWSIGVGAAGSLLAQAIAKFYGF